MCDDVDMALQASENTKKSIVLDLKSIVENETYADMKQALLDLINELEEG